MEEILNTVGKRVVARYRRPGSDSQVIRMEVTGVASIKNGGGFRRPYLLVTRLDGDRAGDVQALRADCFRWSTAEVEKAEKFQPIDPSGWYHTPGGAGSFGFIDQLNEVDAEWAQDELGAQPLVSLMVSYVTTEGEVVTQ